MKRILLASLFLGSCLHAEPEGGFDHSSTAANLEYLAAFGIPAPDSSAKWTHHPQCEDEQSLRNYLDGPESDRLAAP